MPHILICDYILNRSFREKRASFHDCCIWSDMVVYAVADAIAVWPGRHHQEFRDMTHVEVKYA